MPLSSRRKFPQPMRLRKTHYLKENSSMCQSYEAGRLNIKDLPLPGYTHVVTNNATISAADEVIRQNRRITTREVAVELSISKGTVHHIIHKKLGNGKVCVQYVPKHLLENQKRRDENWICQQHTETIHSLPTRWDQCINANGDYL
ncbi:hypothetical protein AVEN_48609-1 [Araneus ventricosus]|uniref:Uncharacterized protein n=1 Tax=Araneus ventricosus TaxID=182803 RepID=A0A4Y2M850_ARAVE|nr:hypothetical protein AVEN_48609-1 [Araneus ventricosus]